MEGIRYHSTQLFSTLSSVCLMCLQGHWWVNICQSHPSTVSWLSCQGAQKMQWTVEQSSFLCLLRVWVPCVAAGGVCALTIILETGIANNMFPSHTDRSALLTCIIIYHITEWPSLFGFEISKIFYQQICRVLTQYGTIIWPYTQSMLHEIDSVIMTKVQIYRN